jgi:photosystem II stability/assembly factor-like uncharacterized protein
MRAPLYLLSILLFIVFCIGCRPIDKTIETEIISSQTTQNLNEVVFSTPDTGFIFGGKRFGMGIVLRTTDGGKTWRADSLCNAGIFSASVRNRRNITTIGQNGQLIYSTNTGNTWQYSADFLWKYMQCIVDFSDTRSVAVGGESYGSGVRSVYENGQRVSMDTIDHELHAVATTDARTAIAVGYGYVCRTTDAARTWQRLDVLRDNFQAIHFPRPEIGYIVGLSGSVWRTDDAGETWKRLRDGNDLFADGELRDVFFTDSNNGFVCGSKGLLWRTNDGGETWQEIPNLPKTNLNKLFVRGNTAFVVGDNGLILKIKWK